MILFVWVLTCVLLCDVGENEGYIFIIMRSKEKAAKMHKLLYTCYQCRLQHIWAL